MRGDGSDTCRLTQFNAVSCVCCADKDGVVDALELAAGLTVLCCGEVEDKARSVFDLYDAEYVPCVSCSGHLVLTVCIALTTYSCLCLPPWRSGDGFITRGEMERYLTAVFRVTGTGAQRSSPLQMARATTAQCFQEADTNRCVLIVHAAAISDWACS